MPAGGQPEPAARCPCEGDISTGMGRHGRAFPSAIWKPFSAWPTIRQPPANTAGWLLVGDCGFANLVALGIAPGGDANDKVLAEKIRDAIKPELDVRGQVDPYLVSMECHVHPLAGTPKGRKPDAKIKILVEDLGSNRRP